MSYIERDHHGKPLFVWDRHGRAHCPDCGQLLPMAGGEQAYTDYHDCPSGKEQAHYLRNSP